MSEDNSETAFGKTGILPPEGEESANFENVNTGVEEAGVEEAGVEETGMENNGVEETAVNNSNSPLGDTLDAVELPESAMPSVPAMTTKVKRTQSAAQQKTIAAQADERAILKSAGVAKPSVAMVATLASMKAKGDSKYNSAFANAVAGKPLNSYRTTKTAKKSRNATVTNTTAKNTNRNANLTNFMGSTAANVRANNGAAASTVKSIQTMGESAISTVREMMRLSTTLTKELAKTNNSAGLARANEWKSNLAPLSSLRNMSRAKPKKPRASRKKKANSIMGLPPLPAAPAGLNTIAEENNGAFTPVR